MLSTNVSHDRAEQAAVVAELLQELTGFGWEVLVEGAIVYSSASDFVLRSCRHDQVVFIKNPWGQDGPKWAFSTSAGDLFDDKGDSLLELIAKPDVKAAMTATVEELINIEWREPEPTAWSLRRSLRWFFYGE